MSPSAARAAEPDTCGGDSDPACVVISKRSVLASASSNDSAVMSEATAPPSERCNSVNCRKLEV